MADKTPQERVRTDLVLVGNMAEQFAVMSKGKYHIRVGIFGDKSARYADVQRSSWSGRKLKDSSSLKSAGPGELTNAELGFVHEMGSKKVGIPRRSFLQDTFLYEAAALNSTMQPLFLTLFKGGKIDLFLKKAAIACENLVQMAFQTGGFGKWPALKPATIRAKGSSMILVRTKQLRFSISSQVVKA